MKKQSIIYAIFICIIDQISKIIIINSFNLYQSLPIINNFFNITYIRNKGAAWGIFNNATFILAILGILCILLIYVVSTKSDKKENILYAILMGGILGNVLDRIFRNGVIDFLDFNIFGYSFPIFNLADIFITMSILILFIKTIGGYNGISK